MKINNFSPSPSLKPYIKGYMVIESKEGMNTTTLPDTSIVIAFRLRGKVSFTHNNTVNTITSSSVSGLRKGVRQFNYSANTATLLVKFNEGGASALFKDPMHELFSYTVSLDNLVRNSILREIEERIAEADDYYRAVLILDNFLLSLVKNNERDGLIHEAIKRIELTKGNIRIKELAGSLPISRDPFEKRFRKITGTSPKQFASIIRLRNVIDNHKENTNLTTIAFDAGYYDQSHFIKDFRLFTGKAPQDFFTSGQWW